MSDTGFFLELENAPARPIHALGILLLSGQLLHAHDVSQINESFRFRVAGMVSTFLVMMVSPCALLAEPGTCRCNYLI